MATLSFIDTATSPCKATACAQLVIGEKSKLDFSLNKDLSNLLNKEITKHVVEPLYKDLGGSSDSENGGMASVSHHYKDENVLKQITFASFSNERSRNSGLVRSDLVFELVKKHSNNNSDLDIICCINSEDEALPFALPVARAFPLYCAKTDPKSTKKFNVSVYFAFSDPKKIDFAKLNAAANGVRLAARLTDMPPSELNTTAYVAEAKSVQQRLKSAQVEILIKSGNELKSEGFGGFWGVGKASEHPPAMVLLTYSPKTPPKKTICMVGKGIVYDTGGLSIKTSAFMPNMKCDMGGSAAILAAFETAVIIGSPHKIHAILCLAENSVDSLSTRPDDILYMYSGKTVEVNNTDAEGRLVLADGVAYATKHLNPDIIVDMATLTGAQSYATGNVHSGVLSNDESLESLLVKAGKRSGDLTFPMIYAPELLGISKQFVSEVADMKNSVKDRGNASSSCAGHFIEEHLVGERWKSNYFKEDKGLWAHLDIAAPAFVNGRGTGYGVGLLLEFIESL